MGRQEDLMNMNYNADARDYKFWIVSDYVPYQLEYVPDGFEDEIIFERNEKYKGVFRKYAANEIKFVKDGRDRVKNIYEDKGINANAWLNIYKLNQSDLTYDLHFSGKMDFSTYKIDEISASVQVMDNNFAEKVKNRENIEVNLLDNVGLEGYNFPALDSKFTKFDFDSAKIVKRAEYGDDVYSMSKGGITSSVTDEMQLTLGFSGITEAEDQTKQTTDYFYRTAPAAISANVYLTISGTINVDSSGNYDFRFRVRDNTGTQFGSVFKTYTNNAPGVDIPFSFTAETDFTSLASGRSLQMVLGIFNTPWYPGGGSYSINITSQTARLEVVQFDLARQETTGIQYYEAFYQILRKITNETNPFHSGFFGRTDSTGTIYASDGQLGVVTKGQLIRGLDSSIDVNFSMSFEDLFASLNAVFNIGVGFEEIGGVDKVRVESWEYFFKSNVMLDISDRISEAEIKKEVLPDWHYAQIKCGYKKFQNEVDGGLFEFNGKQVFATTLDSLASDNNTLKIESPFRADSNGINVSRNEYGTDSSEDVDGDDDVFIVDVVRDPGPVILSDFLSRQDYGFDLVDGVSSDSENLLLTPKRNLLRHGGIIRAGLEKHLNTDVSFQATDRQITMATRLSTETDNVDEMTTELANDLDAPRWWPEAYEVESPFYAEDIRDIETDPTRLIKLSDTKYGWILEIKTSKDNKATLKLLRCNLDHVTPI